MLISGMHLLGKLWYPLHLLFLKLECRKAHFVEVNAMGDHSKISKAERSGHWLGRAVAKGLSGERRMWNWLQAQRVPSFALLLMRWFTRAAVFAAIFYVSFWLVLVWMLLVFALRAPVADDEHDDQIDHRQTLYYDPINYNDDPDPRFDGE